MMFLRRKGPSQFRGKATQSDRRPLPFGIRTMLLGALVASVSIAVFVHFRRPRQVCLDGYCVASAVNESA